MARRCGVCRRRLPGHTIRFPIGGEALRRIQAPYQVEAETTGRTAAERRACSKPLLADLTAWMEAQRRRTSSKTVLGRALQYSLGRWKVLTRYADDGRLAINNNVAERLLCGMAISRENLLFVGSYKGGERAAILHTLIETATLNGLDPEAHLAHAIDQLAHGHLASRLSELLPRNCKDTLAAKAA